VKINVSVEATSQCDFNFWSELHNPWFKSGHTEKSLFCSKSGSCCCSHKAL